MDWTEDGRAVGDGWMRRGFLLFVFFCFLLVRSFMLYSPPLWFFGAKLVLH